MGRLSAGLLTWASRTPTDDRVIFCGLTTRFTICRTLAEKDLIVWEESKAQILGAYPFSGRQTAHRVTIEDGTTKNLRHVRHRCPGHPLYA